VNLQRLRYFLAVADELHFGRAAERLHMAQPPLSQQIRQLESELGVTLFDRTTRRVSLTAAGEVLKVEAERVVVAADSAERVMEEFRSGDGGVLRLAFVDSASFEVMPRFIRAFRERWPKVSNDLQIMSSRNQLDALRSGAIDLGISRTSPVSDDITSTQFLDERLYLVAGPEHPARRRRTIGVADIDPHSLIGFDRRLSPTLHAELQQLFERHESWYDPQIEATEYTTILGLVAAGEGSAIVPNGVRTFAPEGVRYLEIDDPSASMAMYVNHRVHEPLRVVRHAVEVLTDF